MKSEQEFLSGMWITVSNIEYEETEKELARQRNRLVIKQNIIIYGGLMMILISIILAITIFFLDVAAIGVMCGIIIILAYVVDATFFSNHSYVGGVYFENRN